MESGRFDDLSKALGATAGRRMAVTGAIALAVRALVGSDGTQARGRREIRAEAPSCRIQGHPCEGHQQCCPVAGQTVLCEPIPGKGAADRCTVANPPPPPPQCVTQGGGCQFATDCCGELLCIAGVCNTQDALPPLSGGGDGNQTAPRGRKCRSGKAQSKRCRGHQKREHCHSDAECAPGWHCAGGREDSGKHRSCVRN